MMVFMFVMMLCEVMIVFIDHIDVRVMMIFVIMMIFANHDDSHDVVMVFVRT